MSKLIKCKNCGNEIASNAKICIQCGAKNKKPFYKKTWFIIVAILVVIGSIGGVEEEADISEKNDKAEVSQNEIIETTSPAGTEKEEVEEVIVDENIPIDHKNALRKANTYSKMMQMSKEGIYNQLISEYGDKFSVEAAKYAVDNMKVEWNENALKKAKTYSDTMNMSKAGVYNQLTSEHGERFTAEEAQYAIDNLQANWKENALKKAKTYQTTMAMSEDAIYDQLISEHGEGFTAEEAQYAIDNLQ